MYYLYYADEYHNILGYLTSFKTFSKARIVKYFHRHEKLVCLYITNSQQKEILKRYLEILKNYSKNKINYDSRFFEGRDLVELVLSKLEHYGIPLKLFKHEAEIKPFIKTTQKNVKITKIKEAKMARKSYKDILRKNAAKGRKSQKRARELKKNSVTATMKRVKSLLFKGAKGKKNGNTGYVGRIAKGKYIYRTKKSS